MFSCFCEPKPRQTQARRAGSSQRPNRNSNPAQVLNRSNGPVPAANPSDRQATGSGANTAANPAGLTATFGYSDSTWTVKSKTGDTVACLDSDVLEQCSTTFALPNLDKACTNLTTSLAALKHIIPTINQSVTPERIEFQRSILKAAETNARSSGGPDVVTALRNLESRCIADMFPTVSTLMALLSAYPKPDRNGSDNDTSVQAQKKAIAQMVMYYVLQVRLGYARRVRPGQIPGLWTPVQDVTWSQLSDTIDKSEHVMSALKSHPDAQRDGAPTHTIRRILYLVNTAATLEQAVTGPMMGRETSAMLDSTIESVRSLTGKVAHFLSRCQISPDNAQLLEFVQAYQNDGRDGTPEPIDVSDSIHGKAYALIQSVKTLRTGLGHGLHHFQNYKSNDLHATAAHVKITLKHFKYMAHVCTAIGTTPDRDPIFNLEDIEAAQVEVKKLATMMPKCSPDRV